MLKFQDQFETSLHAAVVDYLLNEDVDCILTVEEMLEKYDSVYDTPDPSSQFFQTSYFAPVIILISAQC